MAGATSLWRDRSGPVARRAALDGDTQVDVAVVGGGFTGLWTAYYLLGQDPALRIVVIEAEEVGFGASGRNGGWCVGELAAGYETLAAAGGRDAAITLMARLHDTVAEVGRVVAEEQIACGFVHGGTVRVARNGAQAQRQRDEVDHARDLGFGADVLALLDRDEARARLAATDVLGGLLFAPSAVLQPLDLVRGLAGAVEGRGGVGSWSRPRLGRSPTGSSAPTGAQCAPRWWSGPPRATPRPSPARVAACCRSTP